MKAFALCFLSVHMTAHPKLLYCSAAAQCYEFFCIYLSPAILVFVNHKHKLYVHLQCEYCAFPHFFFQKLIGPVYMGHY